MSDKCAVSGRYFIVVGQIVGCWHILTGLIVFSMYVHFFLGVKQVEAPKKLCDDLIIQDVKTFNSKIKFDHSLEFASVLKI